MFNNLFSIDLDILGFLSSCNGDCQNRNNEKLPHTRVEDIEIQYSAGLIRVGTHGRGVLEAPIIIAPCAFGDPDADNDGVCDANDPCPDFDNSLLGMPCDDGDPLTTGETYSDNCNCEGGASTLTYCAAAGSVGTGGDWIEGVRLHTLDHSSGYSTYSDFRTQSTTLEPGVAYTLEIDLFQSFAQDAVYAWIDYDRDGLFENTELITMSGFDGDNVSTGTVNVPLNIGLQATTMRVRSIFANPNEADPCGNYFGEVEDYTIDFSYCSARGAFGTGDDWIKTVKVNTLDNTSIQTYYSDFKDLSTDLIRGAAYPIEVRLRYAFDVDRVFAWIDYNKDGEFEASERTDLSIGNPEQFNAIAIGNITIPADAVMGETVMRIRSIFSATQVSPCGSSLFGEVEDYTVNLTYCAGSGGINDDHIVRVRFNTIDNESGSGGYSNFTDIETTVAQGSSYPLRVNMIQTFAEDRVYAWIDYDQNGAFTTDEQVMNVILEEGVNTLALRTVNIPADAPTGTTLLRIRFNYAESESPCGMQSGEVEDYTLQIGPCADLDGDEVCDYEDQCIGYSDSPLVLTTNPESSGEWSALTTIESSVTVNTGLQVDYRAGESITLLPGFRVVAGAGFSAVIADCPEEVPPAAPEEASITLAGEPLLNDQITPSSARPELRVFPNPFSHATNIAYKLPVASPLQILVTDIRGRRIATLINTNWQEAGTYRLEWQSPPETSGLLLLYFRTGQEVTVRRLVVTR